ncbi:hypothetical protein KI387_032975, partial [Taxus chinensis]
LDTASENGSGPRVDSRTPSPSNSVSCCQSFSERPHGKPLPLPSTLSSTLGCTESVISLPVPLGNVSWRSSPCLPLPSPSQASNRLDSADVDGCSASSSVSSVISVDSVEAVDLQQNNSPENAHCKHRDAPLAGRVIANGFVGSR